MSKKLTIGKLRDIARDVLSSLDGAGEGMGPDEWAKDLAKESASTRREIFDALGDHARTRRSRANLSTTVALLSPLASPGPGNKPDFPPKYVRSIFDCAKALTGEQSAMALSMLFVALVSAVEKEAGNTKGSAAVDFGSLASIDSFIVAFDAALSSDKQRVELARSRAIWSPLVPEIAARGNIPLSQTSATALVNLLKDVNYAPPAAIRLSIDALMRFFAGEDTSDGDQRPRADAGDAARASPVPPPPIFPALLPEVEKFTSVLDEHLRKLSADFEARLTNQSKAVQRLESEKGQLVGLLDEQMVKTNELQNENMRLNEQLGKLQSRVAESEEQRRSVQTELERYKESHDALIARTDSREQDAVSRTKREFAEKQLVNLKSIRDCIAELGTTYSHERAVRQVTTNFNTFVRFLTLSSYTTQGEIEKIQAPAGQVGDAP